jgi:hypothetical protein
MLYHAAMGLPLRATLIWLAASLPGCSTRQPPGLAQRLGSGDPAQRAAASAELDAMEPRERVALLRAGLQGTGAAATACAKRLLESELDVPERGRVVELLVAALRAGDTDVDFKELRFMLGSSELAALLADFPPAPEGWTREAMLIELHRQVRAEHLPALCELALGPDPPLQRAAFGNLSGAIVYTDQHRETIARTLLALRPVTTRVVEETNRFGLGPPGALAPARAKSGWPDLLCRTLELVFGGSFPTDSRSRGEWPQWAVRWALAVSPAAEDLPLLASLLRGDDYAARVAAVRGLEHVPGAEAAALLRSDAASDDEELAPLALGVLTRRGDRGAAADLEARAGQVFDTLLILLWADPARGREVLAAQLLGDAGRAAKILTRFTWDALELKDSVDPQSGVTWDDTVYEGLATAAVDSGVAADRLARLYAALPMCRTPALRLAATRGLQRDVPQDRNAAETLKPFCCLLEVEDPQALRSLLRAWMRAPDPDVASVGAEWLLDLGDPAAAPDLIRWVAGRDPEDVGALLPRLARSACPEVEAFLRRRALDPEAGEDDARAAEVALAVLHGLPLWPAESVVSARLEEPDRRRVRALVLDGRPIDALLLAAQPELAGREPTVALAGLGLVRDPRVHALLCEFRDRRELGRHTAAVYELAIGGDRAARAEMWGGCEEGRYMWIDDAGADALTLGRDLTTIPFWIREMESNCCRFVPVNSLFRHLLGVEPDIGPFWARTRADAARRWWARYGSRLRWSELAGRFVVR